MEGDGLKAGRGVEWKGDLWGPTHKRMGEWKLRKTAAGWSLLPGGERTPVSPGVGFAPLCPLEGESPTCVDKYKYCH